MAEDCPEVARSVIAEMHRQVGPLRMDEHGLAVRGLLVRHLVMPGMLDETRRILEWLASRLSTDTYVNLMGQYHPDYEVGQLARDGSPKYAEIDRRPSALELAEAHAVARDAGLWRLDRRA